MDQTLAKYSKKTLKLLLKAIIVLFCLYIGSFFAVLMLISFLDGINGF